MEISGKNEGRLQKLVLSCDMFTTGYFAMSLLFFVPYTAVKCGTLVMWFLPLACLLPFVTMPLFYMLVHRFDTLLFGRYHFVMPVSGFVSALFFVMAWSGDTAGASSACLVFFGAMVFVTSALLYRYCAFSVRARLLGEDITAASPFSMVFTFAGGVAAVAVFLSFSYYDSATVAINTAYVLAGVCSLLVIVQYLSTYYSIPRLTGKRVQSVKNVFRSFFSGLDLRMYFSALLFGASFAAVSAIDMYLVWALGLGFTQLGITATALVLCYSAAQFLCVMFVKQRSRALSAVNLAIFCLAAAAVVLASTLKLSTDAYSAFTGIAAAFAGVGGAITTRQTKLRFLTVKPRITSGAVFILLELTACASAAIALLACAAVATAFTATGAIIVFVGGGGLVVAVAVAAFVCAGKRRVPMGSVASPSYELEPDDGNSISGDPEVSDSVEDGSSAE